MKKVNYFYANGLSTRQLITESKSLISFAKRDVEQLQTVGITAELIAKFESKTAELEANVSNRILAGNKKVLTAQRNEARLEVTDNLFILRKLLGKVFSKETAMHDTLFGKPLTKGSFEEFLVLVDDIVEALEQNNEAILAAGVSQLQLDSTKGLINNMLTLYGESVEVTKSFCNHTEKRSDIRKETYELAELVSSIASSYWKRKSPAKAKNFIIRRNSVATSNGEAPPDESF